jgi:hypothetical protein
MTFYMGLGVEGQRHEPIATSRRSTAPPPPLPPPPDPVPLTVTLAVTVMVTCAGADKAPWLSATVYAKESVPT